MEDLVSVIIPIYNEKQFLEKCINSVINQTYNKMQIILVDDGSQKEVADACDEYKKKDERVMVIHKQNEGLSSARITGLEHALGKWIMFVDDDDILMNDAIAILLHNLSDDIDISMGKRYDTTDADDVAFCEKYEYECYTGKEVCEQIPDDIQARITIPLWGKIYRKSFLDKYDLCKYKNKCPTIFFEDVFVTPILFHKARKIRITDKIVYVHREVATSISRSGKIGKFYFEQAQSGDLLLDYCKCNNIDNYYDYYLKMYYKTLLRNYCLLREYCADNQVKSQLKRGIIEKYNKWWREYVNSSDLLYKKMLFFIFRFNPNLWSGIVYRLYYHNRKANK